LRSWHCSTERNRIPKNEINALPDTVSIHFPIPISEFASNAWDQMLVFTCETADALRNPILALNTDGDAFEYPPNLPHGQRVQRFDLVEARGDEIAFCITADGGGLTLNSKQATAFLSFTSQPFAGRVPHISVYKRIARVSKHRQWPRAPVLEKSPYCAEIVIWVAIIVNVKFTVDWITEKQIRDRFRQKRTVIPTCLGSDSCFKECRVLEVSNVTNHGIRGAGNREIAVSTYSIAFD
jgi:hypothetical protein